MSKKREGGEQETEPEISRGVCGKEVRGGREKGRPRGHWDVLHLGSCAVFGRQEPHVSRKKGLWRSSTAQRTSKEGKEGVTGDEGKGVSFSAP